MWLGFYKIQKGEKEENIEWQEWKCRRTWRSCCHSERNWCLQLWTICRSEHVTERSLENLISDEKQEGFVQIEEPEIPLHGTGSLGGSLPHMDVQKTKHTINDLHIMELMILQVVSRQLCLTKLILRCLRWFLPWQITMLSKIYVGCLNFIRAIPPGQIATLYAFCGRSVMIWSSLKCYTRLELTKHLI